MSELSEDSVDPSEISTCDSTESDPIQFESNAQAALFWFEFGFNVIPIKPGSKRPALKWDAWLNHLSPEKISEYWSRHSDHELGFIVGDDIFVLDADSPESIAALAMLEKAFDLTPSLIVKTDKGEHHYFRLAQGTFAKSDSHSTEEYPNRIDVKTGRSMVVLPPSTGKEIEICDASNANELVEVGQEMIDAVAKHNGRSAPRPPEIPAPTQSQSVSQSEDIKILSEMLGHLDPDMGYEDWLHILMAIYHETGGNEEGFELVDLWCSKGNKYKGSADIRGKWESFKTGTDNPITLATIYKMLADKGISIEEQFEICEHIVINPEDLPAKECKKSSNALDKYSLKGKSEEVEKNLVETKQFLGEVALLGQSTVFYAAPNSGKTLITLWLLMEAIKDGRIDPSFIYYLNMDDDSQGLLEKLMIAEEFGFHMLAEGYQDFESGEFVKSILTMIEKDEAKGVVVILDTLKKFTNLMDKTHSSGFTKIMAQFVAKGGTVVALAHTNKNKDSSGKSVYGGTNDIVGDFSCAYILDIVSNEGGLRVVEFENFKRRGNVVATAAYSYCIGNNIPYTEILASVSPVDSQQLASVKQAEQLRSDADIIEAVTACINNGVITKMKLADAVAKKAEISKRTAIKFIEKYAGDDPVLHKWSVTVKARGAMEFRLLNPDSTPPADFQVAL